MEMDISEFKELVQKRRKELELSLSGCIQAKYHVYKSGLNELNWVLNLLEVISKSKFIREEVQEGIPPVDQIYICHKAWSCFDNCKHKNPHKIDNDCLKKGCSICIPHVSENGLLNDNKNTGSEE